VAKRSVVGKNFLHILLAHIIFWYAEMQMHFKTNVSKFGVEWRGVKIMCVLKRKTGHISQTVRESQGYYYSLIGSGIRLFRLDENYRP